MGADYAFSIIYSSLCGVLIIPMILIIVKSITKDRNSRDCYSIMTFLFIFLVLSLRALSIIPELIHGEMISSYGNECEQAVFIGAPMLIFCLAIFVHSFKWLDLEYKLTTVRSFPSLYKTTMSIIIIVNLVVIGIGFSVFCIDIDILNIKTIFAYFIITFYATTYLKLVTINVYLIFKFWRIVKRMHPKLYEEIKVKLNIYFIFIIVLLTARLLFIIPLVIEYYGNYHLIKSSVHTAMMVFLEILPIVMMMFSFITFGSSSKDNIEATNERIARFFSLSKDSTKYKDILFCNDSQDTLLNNDSFQSNEDEDSEKRDSFYTLGLTKNQSQISNLDEKQSVLSKAKTCHKNSLYNHNNFSCDSESNFVDPKSIIPEPTQRIPDDQKSELTEALKSMMCEIGLSRSSIEYSHSKYNSSGDSLSPTFPHK